MKSWVRVSVLRKLLPFELEQNHSFAFKYLPPTVEEQTRIATILSDMDEEISALETKTHQIKQGMMSELLTGNIRLV